MAHIVVEAKYFTTHKDDVNFVDLDICQALPKVGILIKRDFSRGVSGQHANVSYWVWIESVCTTESAKLQFPYFRILKDAHNLDSQNFRINKHSRVRKNSE